MEYLLLEEEEEEEELVIKRSHLSDSAILVVFHFPLFSFLVFELYHIYAGIRQKCNFAPCSSAQKL